MLIQICAGIYDDCIMATQKTFKFQNTAIQFRAPRISEELWEKHKHDIIAQFRLTDLPSMREWMIQNRGFKAT